MKKFLIALTLLCTLSMALSACFSAIKNDNDALKNSESEFESQQPENKTSLPVEEDQLPASEGLVFTSYGNGTCCVSGIGSCTDTELVIPSVSPVGDTVVEINYDAFRFCSSIVKVSIPKNIVKIGGFAFYHCENLAEINFAEGVETIGIWAFADNDCLKSIQFPNSAREIGYSVVEGCDQLIELTVSDQNPIYHSKGNCLIETKAKTLIAGCKASVIPDDGSVTRIGVNAFRSCETLTSINIPDKITHIDNYAFKYCWNLTELILPDSVIEIGEEIADGCVSLKTFVLSKNLVEIHWSLGYTENLESITVTEGNPVYHSDGNCLIYTPDKELTLGSKNSIIPTNDSVTSIGKNAFCYLNIETIRIPNNIMKIGYAAFFDCEKLKTILFDGTMEEWEAISCESIFDMHTNDDITIYCTDGIITDAYYKYLGK